MPLLRRAAASRLDERLCPACGYRGSELQGARAAATLRCPECDEDLYTRPARSYREMEGLIDEDAEVAAEPSEFIPVSRPAGLRAFLARAVAFVRRLARAAE